MVFERPCYSQSPEVALFHSASIKIIDSNIQLPANLSVDIILLVSYNVHVIHLKHCLKHGRVFFSLFQIALLSLFCVSQLFSQMASLLVSFLPSIPPEVSQNN